MDKSEVMKNAWAMYKGASRNLRGERTATFSDCLRTAWKNAKRDHAMTAEEVEEQIFIIQMADYMTPAMYARVEVLKKKLEQKAAA